jgi:hypothetical protein
MKYTNLFVTLLLIIFVGGCWESNVDLLRKSTQVEANSDEMPKNQNTWENCNLEDDSYYEMMTGDKCSFDSGCLKSENSTTLTVACYDGTINSTLTELIRPTQPLKDTVWEDCDALAEGQTGESCSQYFSCYQKLSGCCLEIVSCSEGKLFRDTVCNTGDCQKPHENAPLAANCEEAMSRPIGAACEGSFLCHSNSKIPVPYCSEFNSYCEDNSMMREFETLFWCDAGSLRVLDHGNPEL